MIYLFIQTPALFIGRVIGESEDRITTHSILLEPIVSPDLNTGDQPVQIILVSNISLVCPIQLLSHWTSSFSYRTLSSLMPYFRDRQSQPLGHPNSVARNKEWFFRQKLVKTISSIMINPVLLSSDGSEADGALNWDSKICIIWSKCECTNLILFLIFLIFLIFYFQLRGRPIHIVMASAPFCSPATFDMSLFGMFDIQTLGH